MANFAISKAFLVPTRGNPGGKRPDLAALSDFWNEDAQRRRLHGGAGCYVFSRRMGMGNQPLYVGKTNAKRGFAAECFTDHKYRLLVEGLEGLKGNLYLTLIEYVRDHKGQINRTAILELERFLIAAAWLKNPDGLMNTHGTRSAIPRWALVGVTTKTKGKTPEKVLEFTRMIGL